ncbi:hypothetical protein [Brumimicrobium mesophilum]|uniref:hypothetical protein n=1 Tax=Brumimicrobium mesophilum TaxID=392717 RepID=UPI000D144592|nr:hypothetical protein [Brumimicrobium mesophilum]
MKDFAIQIVDSNDQGNYMDIKVDPIVDTNGKILQGLVIAPTKEQNELLILACNAGEIKSSPTIGVGLADATLDENGDLLSFRHKIRSNYKLDGLSIKKLDLYDIDNVNIESSYE